jgi:hypothetical protein
MALLMDVSGEVRFTLTLTRMVGEMNEPPLLSTDIRLERGTQRFLDSSIVTTIGEMEELRKQVLDVTSRERSVAKVTTLDEDFVFEAEVWSESDYIAIGLWVGEPFGLMKGFRFFAEPAKVRDFVESLTLEETGSPPETCV